MFASFSFCIMETIKQYGGNDMKKIFNMIIKNLIMFIAGYLYVSMLINNIIWFDDWTLVLLYVPTFVVLLTTIYGWEL